MKNFIKKLAKKAEGFTLVELVVVIAILGILAGVAVPAYSGYLQKANLANDEQVISYANTVVSSGAAYVGKTASEVVDSSNTATKISGKTFIVTVTDGDAFDAMKVFAPETTGIDYSDFNDTTDTGTITFSELKSNTPTLKTTTPGQWALNK